MKLHDLVDEPEKLETYGKYISTAEAYDMIFRGRRDDFLFEAILKEDRYAYLYARDILKGRYPQGEKIIAIDPYHSFWYARDVIKGPWLKAGIK